MPKRFIQSMRGEIIMLRIQVVAATGQAERVLTAYLRMAPISCRDGACKSPRKGKKKKCQWEAKACFLPFPPAEGRGFGSASHAAEDPWRLKRHPPDWNSLIGHAPWVGKGTEGRIHPPVEFESRAQGVVKGWGREDGLFLTWILSHTSNNDRRKVRRRKDEQSEGKNKKRKHDQPGHDVINQAVLDHIVKSWMHYHPDIPVRFQSCDTSKESCVLDWHEISLMTDYGAVCDQPLYLLILLSLDPPTTNLL